MTTIRISEQTSDIYSASSALALASACHVAGAPRLDILLVACDSPSSTTSGCSCHADGLWENNGRVGVLLLRQLSATFAAFSQRPLFESTAFASSHSCHSSSQQQLARLPSPYSTSAPLTHRCMWSSQCLTHGANLTLVNPDTSLLPRSTYGHRWCTPSSWTPPPWRLTKLWRWVPAENCW